MSVKLRQYRRRGATTNGWEVDIRFKWPDGTEYRERVRSPLSSKTGSKDWAQQREACLLAQGKEKTLRSMPTLAEFAPRYVEEYAKADRLKPRTVREKQRVIKTDLVPYFGSRKLEDITTADIQKFKAAYADRSPRTVNNILSVLNTMLKASVKWGVLDRLPADIQMVKVDKVDEPRFYEPHEYERLVAAAEKLDSRIHLMVLLGGDAGLRLGEMLALQQTDVDLDRGFITVRFSESEGVLTSPKGRRGRKVKLTARLWQALRANKHLRGERVLWRNDGHPKVTQVLLAKWMMRAQKRAGLSVINGGVHILRHTFCSRLALAGASVKSIQELAGHQHIGTTQRYMHLSPAEKSVAIGLLDQGADLQAAEKANPDLRIAPQNAEAASAAVG